MEGLGKTTKRLRQNSPCRESGSSLLQPEFKSELLPHEPNIRAFSLVSSLNLWRNYNPVRRFDSTVSIGMIGLIDPGFDSQQGIRFLSSECPDRLCRHTASINLLKPSGFFMHRQV
jgi:hypothetical protein